MNLQELLDKLPPEDRQLIIDHFVGSLLGLQPQKEIVIRRTATISTLGNEEEMLAEVAQALNLPIDQLREQNISGKLKEIASQHERSSLLINEYKGFLLTQKATADKFEELYDVGKFLISITPEYKLELPAKVSSIPDFIITHEQKRIGIEHTRLINSETKNLVKTTIGILKRAEQILLAKNPALNQIINISINYWGVSVDGEQLISGKLSTKDKGKIAEVIASYIESLLLGQENSRPPFIENISISEKSVHPLSIVLNENYIAKDEFQQLFSKTISAKEEKYLSYKINNPLDELWLLIVASGVSAASSYVFQNEIFNKQITSQFAKVYLFDNFSHEFVELTAKQ